MEGPIGLLSFPLGRPVGTTIPWDVHKPMGRPMGLIFPWDVIWEPQFRWMSRGMTRQSSRENPQHVDRPTWRRRALQTDNLMPGMWVGTCFAHRQQNRQSSEVDRGTTCFRTSGFK